MSKARDFLEELDAPILDLVPIDTPSPTITDLLPALEQDMVDLVIQGYSVEDIALRLTMPKATITATLKRKDIQESLRLTQEALDEVRISKLKNWYGSVLDDRIDQVDSAGESTRKDTLEVVKAYQDLLLTEKKIRKPEGEQNVYLNILQQVME